MESMFGNEEVQSIVHIMVLDEDFNRESWDQCVRAQYFGVGRLSVKEVFRSNGNLKVLDNDLDWDDEKVVQSIFAQLRNASASRGSCNAIVLVADRASQSGFLHRYYGSAAELWDGLGGDRKRFEEEATRLLELRESTATFGASEFALDLSAAIDAVADYIRENRVDVDAEALLGARFDGGWRVYVPEEPSDDLLDARLGRIYFLVSDDGRVGEVTSAIPPAVAIEDFLAQGR